MKSSVTPGGDNQVQAMLQAFLALAEFGVNVQQAVEAPTVTSSSFAASNYPQPVGDRLTEPYRERRRANDVS